MTADNAHSVKLDTSIEVASKACKRCGETKPLSEFHRNRNSSDGLHYWCKPCTNEASKANRNRLRAEMGEEAWRAHRAQITGRSRAKRGPEYDRLQLAAYRAAERELRKRHRKEFDALYARERYERGLS